LLFLIGINFEQKAKLMLEHQSQKELDINLFINNQYIIVKQIGKGGFGVVWQAYDFSLKNFVAIKELLSEFSEPKFVEMFYKEALIAKNIIHDNIVRVQHFWKGDNNSYYLLMDFVNGVDLEELIKRCNQYQIKIPWELSLLICMSILKAIDYANRIAKDPVSNNSYGIVYRDISPGNILISFDGIVKVSDFGIAKTADEISIGIKQNIVTGKYPYMSPEQIKGLSDVDHRSDIFSIGEVFYETLTGKQLYSGDNSEIRSQILNIDFDVNLLNGLNLPFEINNILEKALKKDRNDRYEMAIEMYRDLRKILKGVEVEEFSPDLGSFVSKVMEKEFNNSVNIGNLVKSLDRQEIIDNKSIIKIKANDFIVGESNESLAKEKLTQIEETSSSLILIANENIATQSGTSNVQAQVKGKTVFEEVGDWFIDRIKNVKSKIIKFFVSIILAMVIFSGIDIFVQITPLGKAIYSRINPPNVVISTIPSGAIVSMKTKDGKVIIENVNSKNPISLRKINPQSYIITAIKPGFRPAQRVIRIEEKSRTTRTKQEKIEIMFDFTMNVNSVPEGASVYVDGNKFGITPCGVQLTAGVHTVKLVMQDFEDLGSEAKEFREGQCDIDFSQANTEEIFTGVDKNYWDTEIKSYNGEDIFSITGHMYKAFLFSSKPEKMTVHIEGEEKSRGVTPIKVNIKAGTYKVKMLDPNGYYAETTEQINISTDSISSLNVIMKRIVSFRVKAKDSLDFFRANLKIEGKDFEETIDITTNKPIAIPLSLGNYNFTFTADRFEPYIKNNVNIEEINSINAEMIYARVPISIIVSYIDKSGIETPIENAFIWINNKIVGKTDSFGVWKDRVNKRSTLQGKVVAQGFVERQFKFIALPGSNNVNKITLISKSIVDDGAVDVNFLKKTNPYTYNTNTVKSDKNKKVKPSGETNAISSDSDIENWINKKDSVKEVVCSNCGYVNVIPPGRKLRFCINCGKPLKY
jgi:serine/threonine-protein kinase